MAVIIDDFAVTPEARPAAGDQPAAPPAAASSPPKPEDLLVAIRKLEARRARLRAH